MLLSGQPIIAIRPSTESKLNMINKVIKTYTPAFKAQVALAAIAEDVAPDELSRRFDLPPHLIVEWKRQLIERAAKVFSASTVEITQPMHVEVLPATFGNPAFELNS